MLRPFQLDLMGITVDVDATTIDPALAPPAERAHRRSRPAGEAHRPSRGSLMRLLALLTPVAMLGALWVLQRLEVVDEPRPGPTADAAPSRARPPRARAQPSDGGGGPAMSDVDGSRLPSARRSPMRPRATGPLLRDPPPPPGYINPLEQSELLEQLSSPADEP